MQPPSEARSALQEQIDRCRERPCQHGLEKSLPDNYKDETKYKLQFVCFTRLAPEQTTAALQEALPKHYDWLQQLDQQGRLAFHGQFLNPEAVNYGSGMYAVYADCTHEAKELASQDPLHQAGLRRFEMLPWVQQLHW